MIDELSDVAWLLEFEERLVDHVSEKVLEQLKPIMADFRELFEKIYEEDVDLPDLVHHSFFLDKFLTQNGSFSRKQFQYSHSFFMKHWL